MSRRSLERRFKMAVGTTPLGYLQQLRVEAAPVSPRVSAAVWGV